MNDSDARKIAELYERNNGAVSTDIGYQRGYIAGYDRATAEASQRIETMRKLLVECDSTLSAFGHHREVTKDEAIDLSCRCRKAAEEV